MSIRSILRRGTPGVAVALVLAIPFFAASGQSLLTSNRIVGATIDFSSLTTNTLQPFASVTGETLRPSGDFQLNVAGSYRLLDNGVWTSAIGTSIGSGSFMRFILNSPLSAAGGMVNDCMNGGSTCDGFSATMRLFDDDSNVIGTYDIDLDAPIGTVGGGSIKYLDWDGSYVLIGNTRYGTAATLTPEPAPEVTPTLTPEPASLALFATGLAAFAGVATRRRRKSA